ELNRLMEQPDFFTPAILNSFALPNEAQRYRHRLTAGETLEPQQLSRLNRLALEAVYPKAVKKIYVAGWRPVMGIFGAAGILVAVLFWWCLRNRPQDHPRCNAAELALIEHGRPAGVSRPDGQVGGLPLAQLAASGNMWLACAQQFFTNIGWVFIVLWLPRYFEEVYH